MRRLAFAAALALALATVPADATAQLRILLGGGLSQPAGDLSDQVDSGLHGRAGVEVGFPLFPLSFRGEGEIHRLPAATLADGNATLLNGSLSAVLSLGGIGVSPYALAGIGSYRLDYSSEFGLGEAQTNTGYHAGFGVTLGILGFGGFLEARFVNVSADAGDTRYIPVTFGLRF